MTFDARSCGARIKELRLRNRLTQERLARDMNITDVHLRRIESGNRGASMELLIEFAEYFQVSLDYLFLGKSSRANEVKQELNEIKAQLDRIIRSL